MHRRAVIFALMLASSTVLLSVVPASAYTIVVQWKPSDSNHLKSYSRVYSLTQCSVTPTPTYRLRIEFELGTVTTTTARIKTVRFWYSQYVSIWNVWQADPTTPIWDNFGHYSYGDDNFLHPMDGDLYTFYVNKTFTFNQNDGITLDRFDEWYTTGGCGGWNAFVIAAHA